MPEPKDMAEPEDMDIDEIMDFLEGAEKVGLVKIDDREQVRSEFESLKRELNSNGGSDE